MLDSEVVPIADNFVASSPTREAAAAWVWPGAAVIQGAKMAAKSRCQHTAKPTLGRVLSLFLAFSLFYRGLLTLVPNAPR